MINVNDNIKMDKNDGSDKRRCERTSLLSRIKSRSKIEKKEDTLLQIESERSSLVDVNNDSNNRRNDTTGSDKSGKFATLANCIVTHQKIKEGDHDRPVLMDIVNDVVKNEFGGWDVNVQKMRRFDLVNTDLLESIEVDDYKWSMKALEKGASVEATCIHTGLTACHIAAYYGREQILEELIKRQANISRVDQEGRLPLDIAAWRGHVNCVDMILRADRHEELLSSSDLWRDSMHHDCVGIKEKVSEIPVNCSALHIASARLQVECIKRLLAADYSPLLKNYEGMTPLDVCGKAYLNDLTSITKERFFETIRLFIGHAKMKRLENDIQNTMKIQVDIKVLTTPLHMAVMLDSKYSIQLLLDINAYPGCQDMHGETPLHVAVAHKMVKSLIALTNVCFVNHDNIVDVLNQQKYTPLHMAVTSIWMKGIAILLEAGANIMTTTKEGDTALHLAVETGNQAVLKELIRNVPDKYECINFKNNRGETPLYTAIICNQLSCLRELILERANCSITLKDNINVLHKSADLGNSKILIRLFEEKNVKELINKQESTKNMTPLHLASAKNHIECVIALCNADANMKLQTIEKETPLHLAAREGHVEIIKWMLDKNQSLMDERDRMKWLPFHRAAYSGHRKCIDLFLERGADFSEMITDYDGNTKTVLATMTSNMHRAVDYLEDVFNNYIKINTYHLDEPDCQITLDYSILTPHRSKVNNVADRSMETMSVVKALISTNNKYDIKKLVIHPLIESFLYLQWKALQRFFYCILLTYGFFVTALTISVIYVYKYENFDIKPPIFYDKMVWKILLWVLIASIFIQEILYAIAKRLIYLKSYEVWVKLASLVLATAVTVIDHKVDGYWARYITTGAILSAWLEIIILLSRFPEFGYFYQMFSTVAVRALKVMALFGCFMIIGFSLAFWILFDSKAPFESPWKSIMKTIVMMTSEFDYADMKTEMTWEEQLYFPQILFVVFLISVPIVVMNLLLALAVSDTKDLETEGKIQRLSQQIDFLSTLDTLVHAVAWKYVPVFIKRNIENWTVPLEVVIMPGQPKWYNKNLFSECIVTSICQRASEKRKIEDNQLKTKTFVSQMDDVQKMLKTLLKNIELDK